MDLSALYATFAAPAGAHLVSDHGQVALLVVRHDHANQATIERIPLGASVALEEALRAAYTAGALPTQQPVLPTISVSAFATMPPLSAAPSREPCPNGCGALLIPGKPGRHLTTCPNRPGAAAEGSCSPN